MPNTDTSESPEGRPTRATILPWPTDRQPRQDAPARALHTLHALHSDVVPGATKADRLAFERAIATALGTRPTPDRRRDIANLLLTLAEELEDQAMRDAGGSWCDDGC